MKGRLLTAALVSLGACASGPASDDHILDIVVEERWRCDDGKDVNTTTHFGLGVVVLEAGNRSYALRLADIDDNGRMRATRGIVVFEAHFDQAPPFRATASVSGASGGPYVNCERQDRPEHLSSR